MGERNGPGDLLGVDESQAALDETPLYLTRAELFQRLPALEEATLARASRIGLVRPHGEDHFGVRSPALLGLVADWVRAGVPLDEALDLIEVLVGDLDTLAGKLAEEIVARIWEPLSAAGRAGELPDLLRRGRLCCSRARPARWPTGSARRWPSAPVPPATVASSWPYSTRYGWARSRTPRARSTG